MDSRVVFVDVAARVLRGDVARGCHTDGDIVFCRIGGADSVQSKLVNLKGREVAYTELDLRWQSVTAVMVGVGAVGVGPAWVVVVIIT